MRLILTKTQLEKLTVILKEKIDTCQAIVNHNKNTQIADNYRKEMDILIPIYQELRSSIK